MVKRKRILEEQATASGPAAHKPSKRKTQGTLTQDEGLQNSTDRRQFGSPVEERHPAESLSHSQHSKSMHTISSPSPIRQALLKWYATVHTSRGMPWRKPYDPNAGADERAQRAYEVWVSEIMLQQTQVATVIPYYNAWMNKFPTIRHLASSSLDEVNSLWKGLGYYSRASRLFAGAQKVVDDFQGRLPDNAQEMEANIPGIGRYSAGAICSIAYGERVPVLDGNVHRLLSRFLRIYSSPKSKATLDLLWAAAAAMVQLDVGESTPGSATSSAQVITDMNHPGDINQALIELGSTVCKVRDPCCGDCPLNSWCQAYDQTKPSLPDIEDICTVCEPFPEEDIGVTAYPMKIEKKKARTEMDIVSVVEWRSKEDRRFLLVRRPNKGLLAGLYEFPATPDVHNLPTKTETVEMIHGQLVGLLQDPLAPYNGKMPKRQASGAHAGSDARFQVIDVVFAGDVVHLFSHIKKTYRVQWVVIEGGDNPPQLKPSLGSTASDDAKHRSLSKDKSIPDAFWAPINEVAQANIGTGVTKMWNLATSLWEND